LPALLELGLDEIADGHHQHRAGSGILRIRRTERDHHALDLLRQIDLAAVVKFLPATRKVGIAHQQLVDRAIDDLRADHVLDIDRDDDLGVRRHGREPGDLRR